jgi:hypothetical protein
MLRVARVADLAGLATLRRLFGEVVGVGTRPLRTGGRSGATHERLVARRRDGGLVHLVLKRSRLSDDWTAFRSGDAVGREAALLAEPALAGVWEAFACHYRAYAVEDGEVGLLMDDLTEQMAPDPAREERLLGALAAMHARFWESPALALPWLAPATTAHTLLGPRLSEEPRDRWPPFGDEVVRGWELARGRLSPGAWELLMSPPDWRDLPHTLCHGDAKLANFAWPTGGGVAGIDWAGLAAAPLGRDLGYYLAINRRGDETLARYRALLPLALSDAEWRRHVDAALLTGALTLLWQKALAGDAADLARWTDAVERLAAD